MSAPSIRISVLTTPPSLKIKVLPKPVVQVKVLPRFPANVYVTSPVLLDRTGGNYTFGVDVNAIIDSLPAGGVSSVFGRTGHVTAQSGDYTFAQIGFTPTTLSGYGITDAQPLDADLTAIAGLITTTFGRSLLTLTAYPTFNQNTTGSAAKLTTARNIDGQAFDGTANITVIAPGTHAATSKTTPVDADEIPLVDSAASNVLKKLTWANLKATIAAYLVSAGIIREKLTANRTYFVLTTGSDSNSGLANTAGGAFLTIAKAISTVAALDLSIYSVNIQVGAGTYTGAVSVTAPWVGSGTVALLGDTTTPANVAIAVTGASAISLTNNATLTLGGFTLSTITAGELVNLGSGSQLTLTGAMGFGACPSTNGKILLASGARFNSVGVNAAISGSTAIFLNSSNASAIIFGGTWTTSGTPAFSNAFVYAQNAAYVQWSGTTFAGTGATGSRYASVAGAVINTFGSGTTYFPGNAAGTGTNPGASPYGFYG